MAQVLREAGYRPELVRDVRAARGVAERGPVPAAVLSDLMVAGSAGPDRLAAQLGKLFPRVPVTLMIGVPPTARCAGVTHDRVIEKLLSRGAAPVRERHADRRRGRSSTDPRLPAAMVRCAAAGRGGHRQLRRVHRGHRAPTATRCGPDSPASRSCSRSPCTRRVFAPALAPPSSPARPAPELLAEAGIDIAWSSSSREHAAIEAEDSCARCWAPGAKEVVVGYFCLAAAARGPRLLAKLGASWAWGCGSCRPSWRTVRVLVDQGARARARGTRRGAALLRAVARDHRSRRARRGRGRGLEPDGQRASRPSLPKLGIYAGGHDPGGPTGPRLRAAPAWAATRRSRATAASAWRLTCWTRGSYASGYASSAALPARRAPLRFVEALVAQIHADIAEVRARLP